MSTVVKATRWWGETIFLNELPKIRKVCNALYVPYNADHIWGLYDAAGRIIDESVEFRGRERLLDRQDTSDCSPYTAWEWAPEPAYIYIGKMNWHYGHFIINLLPRLWWLTQSGLKHIPLLCHSPAPMSALSGYGFIVDILKSLGFQLADINMFDRNTRIRSLYVPDTALHEQFSVNAILRGLAVKVAEVLMPDTVSPIYSEPLYISKSKLKSGVGIFDGEAILEKHARAAGCRVLFPETLSLAEQIRALSHHRTIIGTVGSGFHSLLFCPSPKRLVGLNPNDSVNSNFGLIDRVSGVQAVYFAPKKGMIEHLSGDTFITTHRLNDPERVAKDFFNEALKCALH